LLRSNDIQRHKTYSPLGSVLPYPLSGVLDGRQRLQHGTEMVLKFRDEDFRVGGIFGDGMANTQRRVEGSSLSLDLPKGMDSRNELLA